MEADPNDAPTANGSSEYSRNKGIRHKDWYKFIEQWTCKHPFENRDLRTESIYFSKFLDTRPLDEDYLNHHKGGKEVSLGVEGRLVDRIIAWKCFESISMAEITDTAGIEADEIVYAAAIREEEDNQIFNVRDSVEMDDDYLENEVGDLDGYVNSVFDKLTPPRHQFDQGCSKVENNAVNTIEADVSGIVQTKSRKQTNFKSTRGKLWSNGLKRRIARSTLRVILSRSSSDTNIVETTGVNSSETIESLRKAVQVNLDKQLKKCWDYEFSMDEDRRSKWLHGIQEEVKQFCSPSSSAQHPHTSRTRFRERVYRRLAGTENMTNQLGQCNAITEPLKLDLDGAYTPAELGQWGVIRDQVIKMSNERIDQTPDGYGNEKTKQRMSSYITSLCDPNIDTVICQGEAGSGKTFTVMLCGFLALQAGLLEEIIHTRPLVSAGGSGIGFEPGSVEQKLSFWSKPLTDAFKRLNLDDSLRDKVKPFPFDRLRGISMRPRTWLSGDEAQNMYFQLLECLINRTETRAKFVATGDVKQSDMELKKGMMCGLEMILTGWKQTTEDGTTKYKTIRDSVVVVELHNSLRNPGSLDVRKWLQQLPQQLKEMAKIKGQNTRYEKETNNQTPEVSGKLTSVSESCTNPSAVPVFASFAGVDNLGHAVCNLGTEDSYRVVVVGGSEIDLRARNAFRMRNGFEAMYEHQSIKASMLRGVYMVVSGAPCVAYSLAGARKGRSSKLGLMYIGQIDAYVDAKVLVVILVQVGGVLQISEKDSVSKEENVCAQSLVEDKFLAAGYTVSHQLIDSASYGAPVSR